MYYQLPPLTPGWQVAREAAAGRFYYYNTNTGVVQWDMPAADGGEQGSSIGGLGGDVGSSIGDLRGERHDSIGVNEALSLDLEKRVGRIDMWTEDEHVELLDLVQRVGLDGGWQAVKAAANAGNVLTRRSVDTMKQQYCLVKGLLRQHLPAEELDALSLDLEKRVGGDKWTEDEHVELLDLVQRVGLDGGWQAVKAAANAGNSREHPNVRHSPSTCPARVVIIAGLST